MEKPVLWILLAILMLIALNIIAPASILAQSKNISKTPVKIEDLTLEILKAPKEVSDDKVKFFDFEVKTLSEVSVNLYDESKKKLVLVSFRTKSPDTTEYEIQSPGKKEFVQIKKSENNGKIFLEAVSSSEDVSKIVLQVFSRKQICENAKKILSVGIANGDIWESFLAALDTLIEDFNDGFLHSALGYKTPNRFEKEYFEKQPATLTLAT